MFYAVIPNHPVAIGDFRTVILCGLQSSTEPAARTEVKQWLSEDCTGRLGYLWADLPPGTTVHRYADTMRSGLPGSLLLDRPSPSRRLRLPVDVPFAQEP